MGLIETLLGLIGRIPQSFIGFLIAASFARIYLQLHPPNRLRGELIDRLWSFFVVYVVVTRFSGFLIYPGTLKNLNLFTFLAQPPKNGWFLGLIIALTYLVLSLRKADLLQAQTLYLSTAALLWAGLGVFSYQALLAGAPYRNQDLLRLTLTIGLLSLMRAPWLRSFWSSRPSRLWLAMGVGMLATSIVVPILDKWWIFSCEQWIAVAIILGAVLSEGIEDTK